MTKWHYCYAIASMIGAFIGSVSAPWLREYSSDSRSVIITICAVITGMAIGCSIVWVIETLSMLKRARQVLQRDAEVIQEQAARQVQLREVSQPINPQDKRFFKPIIMHRDDS